MPFFRNPGLIDHQHTRAVPQMLDHIAAHIITYRIGIPVRAHQQPLHPVRVRLPGPLRQRPGVLALQRRQQPAHIGQHPLAWFQTRNDSGVDLLQPRRPRLDPSLHQPHQSHKHHAGESQSHTGDTPTNAQMSAAVVLEG